MRIVVDVMGSDHGAETIIEGVRMALESQPSITRLFLVGQEAEINAAINRVGCADPRIAIVPATQVLSMEDKPVEGLRRKKDCSILRAVDLLKDGKADALVSPGNTGGIVAASTIRLRPLPGVDRPCIATIIPAPKNEFVLLDAGASVECRPMHLLHFAVMGNIYSREILGYKNPRVGILSNGTEPNKGTELTLEAYKLCKRADFNFIGNVEGHDLFHNKVDVVVCDGFIGNIVLKTLESFAKGMGSWLKEEIHKNPKRMLGGLLVKNAVRTIMRRTNPDTRGGAPLLGLNGTVFKAHGSARERAIMNAINECVKALQHRLNEMIQTEVEAANQRVALVPQEAAVPVPT
ncbi:MAG TPA: phosphate acyltransferase PlsX [Verrucomicrobiae bacterium]|jgi:glycerol-3-phosphate acyltransferase PlsX|nr:phosphate acyltransferase PlsX [Verrucomicrobiae bacterium]